jgi:FkbM family methyltransferase
MSIRDIGRSLIRAFPAAEHLGRSVYSNLPGFLHETPTTVAQRFFQAWPSVSLVQIGAYDGQAGDPMRPLLFANTTWRGVLIEPQAEPFAGLQQNYADLTDRLHFLNVELSERRGTRTLYSVTKEEAERLGIRDLEWVGQLASFDAAHLRQHFPTATLHEQSVDLVTFAEAAALLPNELVDLIVMDVEGHEGAILDTIDFDRHRVAVVIYEHRHMDGAEQQRVEGLLQGQGFSLKRFGNDTIAWRAMVPHTARVTRTCSG